MTENEHLKKIIYYKTIDGRCPYDEWLDSLDYKAKAIIEYKTDYMATIKNFLIVCYPS